MIPYKKQELEITVLEGQLASICQEIYCRGGRMMIPKYPWVLVRLLPKEQQSSLIYLPESQNKVVYEGIVLAVWRPFKKVYSATQKSTLYPEYKLEGELKQSQYKPGDRVCFGHFEGFPVPYLNFTHPSGSTKADNLYRVVREETFDINCGILGEVFFTGDEGLGDKLNELFRGKTMSLLSGK